MFRNGTTFVIGAGASAEFGMPVGTDLAKLIRKSAYLQTSRSPAPPGDATFTSTIGRLFPNTVDQTPYVSAAKAIHEGIHTAVSIDAFIDRNSGRNEVEVLGKMLIALEIVKAEEQSSLHQDNWKVLREDPKVEIINAYGKALVNPDDTWLGQFFRILCDGVRSPEELGQNITIICFNYDRCIEYYLRTQIADAYQLSYADADAIVKSINIIHPYGTIGELPLNPTVTGEGLLAFGAKRDGFFKLEEAAKTIKTYTERKHNAKLIGSIHNAIANCNVLTFLGFGFNNQNLDLLRLPHTRSENGTMAARPIFSSGFGIAQQVESTMKRRILHLLWPHERQHAGVRQTVQIEFGQTCADLFRTHNMNFSSFQRAYFSEDPAKDGSVRVIVYEREGD